MEFCLVEAQCRIVEARTVLQVREAGCCKVEDRVRIVEAHGVLAFLPSLYRTESRDGFYSTQNREQKRVLLYTEQSVETGFYSIRGKEGQDAMSLHDTETILHLTRQHEPP